MKSLSFRKMELEELPSLSRLPVEELCLMGNFLQTLRGIPLTVKELDLTYNDIWNAEEVVHSPLPHLETLNLSKNPLQFAHHHSFKTCFPALKHFVANDTPIKYLDFLEENSLESLTMNRCALRTVEHLPKSLKQLRIEESSVRVVQTRLPETLEQVSLRSNKLCFAGLPFRWGSNLHSLYLDFNRIEKFPKNLPDSLETLTLCGNSLEIVPEKIPAKCKILLLTNNRIRIFPRFPRNRFVLLGLNENELTEIPDISIATSFQADFNWNTERHHASQRKIKLCWKRYLLRLRLRHFHRVKQIRKELFDVSMMPERCFQLLDVDSPWFRKGPNHIRTDHRLD